MIGRAVSVFGKGALRSRSSNLAIRGENAPGMVRADGLIKMSSVNPVKINIY